MNGKILDENSKNINAATTLFNQISVLNRHHAAAPYGKTFPTNPLLKSAEVLPKGELFQAMIPRTDMDPRVAGPLSENETALLEEGLHRFDTGQF